MVKSRRARSSVSETPNSTRAWRPSVCTSRRNVVTSCGRLCVSSTATVPCSMPTGTVRRNNRCTTSGTAAVVRSKSWFSRPSRVSRTAPPTHQVSYPSSSRRRAMRSTSCGMWSVSGKLIGERGAGSSRLRHNASTVPPAATAPRSPLLRSPTQHTPAVHVEDLPGDVTGQRGAEKHDRPCDVLGAGHPAQRDPALDLAPSLPAVPRVRQRGHLGVDPPGGDAVDGDAWGELDGERLGEGDDGPLGGSVVGMKRLAALPRGRGDEDDLSSIRDPWDGGTADVHDAVQVGAPGFLPLRVTHRRQRHVLRRPNSVVNDEDVD